MILIADPFLLVRAGLDRGQGTRMGWEWIRVGERMGQRDKEQKQSRWGWKIEVEK